MLQLTEAQLAAIKARQATARTVSPLSEREAKETPEPMPLSAFERAAAKARERNAARLATNPRMGRPEKRQQAPGKLAGHSSKYGNVPTIVDGVRFASKREAGRYGELKLLEKAGEITDLRLQPAFWCEINGVFVCTYIADFDYTANGRRVVEDVKGVKTAVYRLKKRLVKATHGIEVREV